MTKIRQRMYERPPMSAVFEGETKDHVFRERHADNPRPQRSLRARRHRSTLGKALNGLLHTHRRSDSMYMRRDGWLASATATATHFSWQRAGLLWKNFKRSCRSTASRVSRRCQEACLVALASAADAAYERRRRGRRRDELSSLAGRPVSVQEPRGSAD